MLWKITGFVWILTVAGIFGTNQETRESRQIHRKYLEAMEKYMGEDHDPSVTQQDLLKLLEMGFRSFYLNSVYLSKHHGDFSKTLEELVQAYAGPFGRGPSGGPQLPRKLFYSESELNDWREQLHRWTEPVRTRQRETEEFARIVEARDTERAEMDRAREEYLDYWRDKGVEVPKAMEILYDEGFRDAVTNHNLYLRYFGNLDQIREALIKKSELAEYLRKSARFFYEYTPDREYCRYLIAHPRQCLCAPLVAGESIPVGALSLTGMYAHHLTDMWEYGFKDPEINVRAILNQPETEDPTIRPNPDSCVWTGPDKYMYPPLGGWEGTPLSDLPERRQFGWQCHWIFEALLAPEDPKRQRVFQPDHRVKYSLTTDPQNGVWPKLKQLFEVDHLASLENVRHVVETFIAKDLDLEETRAALIAES